MSKRILCLLLALAMAFTALPITTVATEQELVYLSVSYDGQYINDQFENPIVYLPIPLAEIAAIRLEDYGLEEMLYDADGDGAYETTALQLLIYAHENLYGGDWSEVAFDAIPGSSYFRGGIFGFTENLMYFHNGDFPVDSSQESSYMTVGATSDRIVLQSGDFLDVASFECYSFIWDMLGGFHFFADEEENFLHHFTAQAGEPLRFKLMHSFCDLMFGNSYLCGAADYEIFYGKAFGIPEGTLTTDTDGFASLTLPAAGTYFLWCNGAAGSDDGTHTSCDHYTATQEPCIVSAPAYATLTVEGDSPAAPSRQPQDVTAVLNATMAQLAATVPAPSFGTTAGEWTVFSLARGGYYPKDHSYFKEYINRIEDVVNETAAAINLNGALDKNKSTENSRLIVALSALGMDATAVGDWNLAAPYAANGINWIKKQGMNGTIWALLALDSNGYATDTDLRTQCVEAILGAQHEDGGWSLVTNTAQPSNTDITGMALTALAPYRADAAVAAACEKAIAWLSATQLESGGFPYGSGETSESCAWVIVALSAWGINPDTDPRFIKNGHSPIDNLLTYYLEEEARFAHQGTEANAIATDQACYALIAYQRLLKEQPALFDYSDVSFTAADQPIQGQPKATLGLPAEIPEDRGSTFQATLCIDQWSNEAGFKMIDLLLSVPAGLTVTDVTAGNRFSGGEIRYHQDAASGALRLAYFDANQNRSITASGNSFPALLFTVTFKVEAAQAGDTLAIRLEAMSLKRSSDPNDTTAMVVVDTAAAAGTVAVVKGTSYTAACLYIGDDIDQIPSTKKAVAVAVAGITPDMGLTYNDGTYRCEMHFSPEITAKTGVATYIALVDASIPMAQFAQKTNYTLQEQQADTLSFGDANGDQVINAQDALAAVDCWLRKSDAPSDKEILALNVNSDSRINTFDALGIAEAFVDSSEYLIVTRAAALFAESSPAQ